MKKIIISSLIAMLISAAILLSNTLIAQSDDEGCDEFKYEIGCREGKCVDLRFYTDSAD